MAYLPTFTVKKQPFMIHVGKYIYTSPMGPTGYYMCASCNKSEMATAFLHQHQIEAPSVQQNLSQHGMARVEWMNNSTTNLNLLVSKQDNGKSRNVNGT